MVQNWIDKHTHRNLEIPTKEQFYRRIKTLGHSTDDESDALFSLKRLWIKATRTDKESLFSWLKEAR